jgi:hypothetical protein
VTDYAGDERAQSVQVRPSALESHRETSGQDSKPRDEMSTTQRSSNKANSSIINRLDFPSQTLGQGNWKGQFGLRLPQEVMKNLRAKDKLAVLQQYPMRSVPREKPERERSSGPKIKIRLSLGPRNTKTAPTAPKKGHQAEAIHTGHFSLTRGGGNRFAAAVGTADMSSTGLSHDNQDLSSIVSLTKRPSPDLSTMLGPESQAAGFGQNEGSVSQGG